MNPAGRARGALSGLPCWGLALSRLLPKRDLPNLFRVLPGLAELVWRGSGVSSIRPSAGVLAMRVDRGVPRREWGTVEGLEWELLRLRGRRDLPE
jgi:hypothetical protein